MISPTLLEILYCPYGCSSLIEKEEELVCERNHSFAVIHGIPVLLPEVKNATLWVSEASLNAAKQWKRLERRDERWFTETLGLSHEERTKVQEAVRKNTPGVDPVVNFMQGATSGDLYLPLQGRLKQLPIPNIPFEEGEGLLLDVGCNWGRWTVSAAQKGYLPVGIDPSLGALLAAQRITKELGLKSYFICGDSRFLPFKENTFPKAFSYSVLQHFSKTDAEHSAKEIKRVLRPKGSSLIQMPNGFGIRSIFHLFKRKFRRPQGFLVRYYTPFQLLSLFQKVIGPSKLSVDGFLGLGVQNQNYSLLPLKSKIVVLVSEGLKKLPFLKLLADSLYVHSYKEA